MEEPMEVDIKEEPEDEKPILEKNEMEKISMKKLEKLKNLKVTAKFG